MGGGTLELDAISRVEVGDGGKIKGASAGAVTIVVVDTTTRSQNKDIVAPTSGQGVVAALAIQERACGDSRNNVIPARSNDDIPIISGAIQANGVDVAQNDLGASQRIGSGWIPLCQQS